MESAKSVASSSAPLVAEKGLASAARSLADGRLPRVDVSRLNCGAHVCILGFIFRVQGSQVAGRQAAAARRRLALELRRTHVHFRAHI